MRWSDADTAATSGKSVRSVEEPRSHSRTDCQCSTLSYPFPFILFERFNHGFSLFFFTHETLFPFRININALPPSLLSTHPLPSSFASLSCLPWLYLFTTP